MVRIKVAEKKLSIKVHGLSKEFYPLHFADKEKAHSQKVIIE